MSLYARGASFPPGKLCFFAGGVNFCPDGGQNTYGYGTNDEDDITEYYLNGKQVSRETLGKKMVEDKSLAGLNFERNLSDREVSSWFLGSLSDR